MALTDKDVYSTVDRTDALKDLIKKTETAASIDELKAIVGDLCRVLVAEVESGHSAQFD